MKHDIILGSASFIAGILCYVFLLAKIGSALRADFDALEVRVKAVETAVSGKPAAAPKV